MKKILLILAVAFATASVGSEPVSAQERVITASVSNMLPSSVNVLDEYISSQLYTGSNVFSGLNFRIGTFYKEHDNLSWDIYYTGYQRDKTLDDASKYHLTNPSGSQRLRYSSWSFGYGTYYHWRFGEKLMLKAGGVCDIYGALKEGSPDGVNNHINFEGQIMFKGHAAIKYGWDFEKWGLDLRANLSLPAFGIITADHPSEPAMSAIIRNDHSVMQPTFRHIFLGFYHNYMSLDYELGVDFVFKPFTLQLACGSTNKWWNVYDIQNIRQINYLSLGCVIDIVTRSRYKTSNNNF